MCPSCDCWFQSPLQPSVYEQVQEQDAQRTTGSPISEHDEEASRHLAEYLYGAWIGGRPAKTLDVGAAYPYLAHCLQNLGCDAFALNNIEVVPQHSRMLGVPILTADFERISQPRIEEWTATRKFRLITLVHVFEYLYDPLAALQRLRRLLADDGSVFMRLPDHRVRGFERHLTSEHNAVRPYFHTLSSLLELLVQGGDLFTVAHTFAIDGSGLRDLVLRPLARKPIVYAGVIVKNEERDLPRCLRSIESIVDGVVVVDTGSTDATLQVATTTIAKPLQTRTFTDASRQDVDGDWKLWDFGRARNVFIDEIERCGADYILWIDADDELITPQTLRRAVYWNEFDVFGVQIESAGQRWTHHRLWKTGLGIHFEGRCHEYPTIGGHAVLTLTDSVIRHDAAPGTGESANERNLRILLEEFAEHPNARTAFYLGNTHKDAGRYADAVPWYARRIEMGPGFRDEWLFAHLYKARCERAVGDTASAEKTLLEAVSKEQGWAEFWMELTYLAYEQQHYRQAIGYAKQALGVPIPDTPLWREPNKYVDQPSRMISWCHEHLGDVALAHAWALHARGEIGASDVQWEERITRLEATLRNKSVRAVQAKFAINRAGAIGDILMTLNLMALVRDKYPRHAIHYFCDATIGESLADVMHAAGVDVIESSAEFLDRKSEFAAAVNLIGYPLHEGYPEQPMRQHLLHYFAQELGFELESLPSLQLPRPARPGSLPARYASLQVKAGWSPYKNWPVERWADVLRACPDIPVYQIGSAGEPAVPGAQQDFMGKPMSVTVALIANASLHVGIDSFANHLTHYLWTNDTTDEGHRIPGVILWGSTQASATGYAHNVNISLGLPCQPCFREDPAVSKMPRGICINPPGQTHYVPRHACMFGITVEQVAAEVRRLWSRAAEVSSRPRSPRPEPKSRPLFSPRTRV